MVENKEAISVDEFKAWLVGLIRGKNGTLPNLDDWKQIKIMLDKVQGEKVVVKEHDPFFPYIPNPTTPHIPTYPNWDKIWYWDSTGTAPAPSFQYTCPSYSTEYMLMNGTSTVHDSNSTLDLTDLDKIFEDWT